MKKVWAHFFLGIVAGALSMTTNAFSQSVPARLRAINPPGPSIPGISAGVLISEGKLLFLSGHVPITADSRIPEGLEAQLRTVFDNLSATLRAAGADFRSVARITIMVRNYDASMLPTIRRIRDEYIDPSLPPASALVGVASLFDDRVLVEIDAIAVVN